MNTTLKTNVTYSDEIVFKIFGVGLSRCSLIHLEPTRSNCYPQTEVHIQGASMQCQSEQTIKKDLVDNLHGGLPIKTSPFNKTKPLKIRIQRS